MDKVGNGRRIILSAKNVSKEFRTKRNHKLVISDVSFDVYENEFLVLLGPGQCGKTTLLEMIAGLQNVSGGRILHNEKEVAAPDASRAVVYQTIALFPWLTVMGNVSFGPSIRGVSKQETLNRARKCIDMVGLSGFENAYPNQLSGGMKQRVGIARAYCNNPDILLMDEPFGHLDAQTRYLMQEELMRIWEQEKRTIVFVTNNIEEAIFLADRIVLMTNCPSTIKTEYKIDLPRPRDIVSPEFLRLRAEISAVVDKSI